MKIVIPSKGRPHTIKTNLYLDQGGVHDYIIVLHNEEERKNYLCNKSIRPETLVVSGADWGISNQRNWIIGNLIEKGEWYISLDDNIDHFEVVNDKYMFLQEIDVQSKEVTQKDFSNQINALDLLCLIKKDIIMADRIGACYCGMAVVDNYYFRAKKYRTVGYCISKAVAIKHMGITYDPKIQAMDDYGFTAENLVRFGKVLINNWIFPKAGHYEQGGIGTYEQRLPKKIADGEYLMKKYPGLFRYKEKKGCDPRAEIQFRFTNEKQVRGWVAGHLLYNN